MDALDIPEDETALAEIRDAHRARLEEAFPKLTPEGFRRAAREQLLFWLRRADAHRAVSAHFKALKPRDRGLALEDTLAVRVCFESDDDDGADEILLLLALIEGEREAAEEAAAGLGIALDRDSLAGPFWPGAALR